MNATRPHRSLGLLLAAIAPLLVAADGPRPAPAVYDEIPLGAIRPTGWLEAQLRVQADGLGGHIDEFWPDIRDSAWIGGKAEGWERTPYWLDGAIPLAFLLDDARLKAKLKRFVDYILDHQAADGWLGPVGDNDPGHKPYDVWPLFVLFKALAQYQEATGDPRVVPALLKCSSKIDDVISKTPMTNWAHFRGADLVVGLLWLHRKTDDPNLIPIARKVIGQSYDWRRHFDHFAAFRRKTPGDRAGLDSHGVNHGMGLKFAAVRSRLKDDPTDRFATRTALHELDGYHGQATGVFTCDEHLAGTSPSQGTELCTVVEAMYSLELAEAISGDAALGDRLEQVTFNALPATFKKDMTAHQYDQQANQVACRVVESRVYTSNGPDANLYGLEPNFGCCAANMHQGWPKFATHLWAWSPDGGLVAMAYAPSVVTVEADGQTVSVETVTDYPFRDTITLRFSLAAATTLAIRVRVPAWSDSPTASVDGQASTSLSPGTFALVGPARWPAGAHEMKLKLPMPIRVRRGENGSASILAGPLVFALPIDPEWRRLRGRDDYPDYEVLPRSPWNYALAIDPAAPAKSVTIEDRPMTDRPFTAEGAPRIARVTGRRLTSWGLVRNAAAPPPISPVIADGPPEALHLAPYGTTDLRITEFPILAPNQGD